MNFEKCMDERNKNIENYKTTVNKIVNQINSLIIKNPNIKDVFINNINQLCKMVDKYCKAQEPFSKKLKKAQQKINKFTSEQFEQHKNLHGYVSPIDLCPEPKGYINIHYIDKLFINTSDINIYRAPGSINPLLWFGFFGNASLQRRPSEKEKLMCNYVLLAIIHDYVILSSSRPTDHLIYPRYEDRKYFKLEKFYRELGKYYCNQTYEESLYHPASLQGNLLHLDRVFEHLKVDIKKQMINEKENKSSCKTVILTDAEKFIIKALGKERINGEKLAKKAGYPFNSNFKSTLSQLRKREILDNLAPGYILKSKYYYLLSTPDQGQD